MRRVKIRTHIILRTRIILRRHFETSKIFAYFYSSQNDTSSNFTRPKMIRVLIFIRLKIWMIFKWSNIGDFTYCECKFFALLIIPIEYDKVFKEIPRKLEARLEWKLWCWGWHSQKIWWKLKNGHSTAFDSDSNPQPFRTRTQTASFDLFW